MRSWLLMLLLLLLTLCGCAGVPDGVSPVTNFELDRYLGKWYEIARLDHRFERGLEKVTATYSMEEDGSVRVANRGYAAKENSWSDAIGSARFAGESGVGHLEVSFFGPFYGTYLIFELDEEDYQYAFVTGGQNYLWLLARKAVVSDELRTRFLQTVESLGYNSDELIFVNQQ